MVTWLTASIHSRGCVPDEIDEVEAGIGRHVGEDRRKFGGEQLQPHLLRLAQLDDDVVAVGGGVLHLADRIGEPQTAVGALLFGWIGHGPLLGSSYG